MARFIGVCKLAFWWQQQRLGPALQAVSVGTDARQWRLPRVSCGAITGYLYLCHTHTWGRWLNCWQLIFLSLTWRVCPSCQGKIEWQTKSKSQSLMTAMARSHLTMGKSGDFTTQPAQPGFVYSRLRGRWWPCWLQDSLLILIAASLAT